MKAENFERFRSSLLRCVSNLRFLDRFYNEFFSSSHEVREVFSKTDMERQKAMLNASLYQLMNFYEKPDKEAKAYIKELGAIHGNKALNIPPHLYDLWLESLLVAVSACDPDYDESLENIWREVMQFGISIMKDCADEEPDSHMYTRATPEEDEEVNIDAHQVREIIRILNQLGKEAAHRSNVEYDMEVTAFQFGQYRAYLHASELLLEIIKRKKVF